MDEEEVYGPRDSVVVTNTTVRQQTPWTHSRSVRIKRYHVARRIEAISSKGTNFPNCLMATVMQLCSFATYGFLPLLDA